MGDLRSIGIQWQILDYKVVKREKESRGDGQIMRENGASVNKQEQVSEDMLAAPLGCIKVLRDKFTF